METFLTWIESSRLARLVLENAWVFPTLETLHFFGLILLIGSIYIVDLRLLGFAPSAPMSMILRFVPVSLVGFAINLVTGIMFLTADPFRYYPNPAFRLKMLAILLAGANVLWFKWAVHAKVDIADQAAFPKAAARTIALVSIGLWTSVIVFGRMIPYVE